MSLDDLEEFLSETSPVVLRKLRPAPTAGEIDPYRAILKSGSGSSRRVDVRKRLPR